MAYMKDPLGRKLDALVPSRDVLPEVLNHFDASTLSGANNSAVAYWADSGPFGWDVWQDTAGSRPVLKTAGLNGKNYVSCVGNKFLARPAANQHYWLAQSGAYGIPLTFFAVIRAKSGSYTPDRAVIGSATQGTFGVLGSSTVGGSAQLMQQNRCYGDDIADDTWHVIAAVGDAAGTAVWIDGVLAAALSGTAGTYALQGAIGVGALANGTQTIDGDIAEIIVANGRMSHKRVADTSAALAKWGLSAQHSKQISAPSWRDVTTSTSDNLRLYPPRDAVFGTPSSTTPVILWSHPASQNEQATAGYFLYPLVHAAYNNGWIWAGYRGHTDAWGNQTGLDDLAAAVAYIRANYSTGPIILGGGGMGGLSTAVAVAGGGVPGLKGAFVIDGAFNLASMFAGNAGPYSPGIRTAYGIAADGSEYASKTAGHDPVLVSSASYGTTVPWRFYASAADTAVDETANTDAFVSVLGAVPEKQVVTHVGGHLANDGVRARDWTAFVKRSLAR